MNSELAPVCNLFRLYRSNYERVQWSFIFIAAVLETPVLTKLLPLVRQIMKPIVLGCPELFRRDRLEWVRLHRVVVQHGLFHEILPRGRYSGIDTDNG